MTITAQSGPFVAFGVAMTSSAGTGLLGNDLEHNEQRAPSLFDLGIGMMDPRVAYQYDPGSGPSAATVGFYGGVGTVDFVPASVNSSAFLVSTGSSGLTTFTLLSTGAGITQTTIVAPETGKTSETLLCIDSTAVTLVFGVGGITVWNPGAGAGRNITIKPSSNLDAGSFSIAGRDIYGFKMTETIAGGSTSLAGKKAFKYISSITNTTTPTSTGVLIGFGDVYGFPLAVPYTGMNAQVMLLGSAGGSSAVIVLQSTATTVVASTVATQTSTTPDVRGTFSSTTASNGTLRLQMIVTPAASAIATVTSTNIAPLFGATQFSSI